jgi:DNA-binding NarL/FixJ family response regulator
VSEIGAEPLIRVLLLIENRLLRESLGRIFRKRADFLVVGSRGNEDSSLEKVFETQCDVVVLDFLDARWFPVNLRSMASNCSAAKFLLIAMSSFSKQCVGV